LEILITIYCETREK